jgi:hypothetical protein
MRVAVIVVTMVVATTPLEASKSCMSKTEAREHFGSVHIYWHGPDHCWDATPGRHHQIQGVRRRTPTEEVRRKPDQPRTEQSSIEKSNVEKSGRNQSSLDLSSWRDSMSAMLPDVATSRRATADPRLDGNGDPANGAQALDRATSTESSSLASRWVDIAQVVPLIDEREPIAQVVPHTDEPNPAPPVPPHDGAAPFIACALLVGTIAFVFVIPIYQRRRSTADPWDAP